MEKQTKLYQKWWFWVCVIVIVCVISGIIVLTNNKNTSTSTIYTNNNIFSSKVTKENVIIEKLAVVHNDTLIIKIKNNNKSKVVVDEISAILKDENGDFMKKVNCMDSNIPINAGQEVISYIWEFNEDLNQYSNIEFEFRINDDISGMYPADLYICDNFEINANNTGKQIAVTVKNNNSDICSVQLNVVYYKNDEIVGFSTDISDDIEANSQGYINLDYPRTALGDEIEFNDYKVNFVKAKKH